MRVPSLPHGPVPTVTPSIILYFSLYFFNTLSHSVSFAFQVSSVLKRWYVPIAFGKRDRNAALLADENARNFTPDYGDTSSSQLLRVSASVDCQSSRFQGFHHRERNKVVTCVYVFSAARWDNDRYGSAQKYYGRIRMIYNLEHVHDYNTITRWRFASGGKFV